MNINKYKVGDRLIIVKNTNGHHFKIGATVIILEVFIDKLDGWVHYAAGWGKNTGFVEDEELIEEENNE